MNAIKNFSEFVRNNTVKKQSPDRSRAEYLIGESNMNYIVLKQLEEKLKLDNTNSNLFIKSCYDIIMELVRAKMLLDGYNASGFGAHEAEVSYLRVLGFSENEVQFADKLRFFRNGMIYYGTILDKEYAEQVLKFTKKAYARLKQMLKP